MIFNPSYSGGMQTKTTLEYLDPKFADYTWRLKNETKNILAGKFRHCLVALPGKIPFASSAIRFFCFIFYTAFN